MAKPFMFEIKHSVEDGEFVCQIVDFMNPEQVYGEGRSLVSEADAHQCALLNKANREKED